jgi:hypothetical protein
MRDLGRLSHVIFNDLPRSVVFSITPTFLSAIGREDTQNAASKNPTLSPLDSDIGLSATHKPGIESTALNYGWSRSLSGVHGQMAELDT